jgi:hypothetical protein
VIAAKAAAGAAIDAGAQVTVQRASGKSWSEAFGNIDYTSVGASAVIGGATTPGAGTVAKSLIVGAIATDALIDISANETKSLGGIVGENKSVINVGIDAAASFVPGKVVDKATENFTKAVATDLGSNAAATLTKQTKKGMKQAAATVKSETFQTTANAMADYSAGLLSGTINENINTKAQPNQNVPALPSIKIEPPVMQQDNTRVINPSLPQ